MQFNPDAAPSSANMNTYLGPSQNLLTCRLTKAVWWYRPSPGEGKPDCQSLFGRLDWSEEIANPSPLGRQSNSRAKWVGKTTLLQSRHTTAFVECSSAVRSQTSEIGVSDAPTDRSDTRGGSVGAFSSVRRAGRLRIANGHARHRISGFTRRRWVSGEEPLNLQYSWTRSPCVSAQPQAAPFSDLDAPGLDPQGVAVLPSGKSVLAAPGPHKQGLPLGSAQQQAGEPMGFWYQPGTHGVPRHRQRNDPQAALTRRDCGERPADPRAGHFRSTRCCGSGRRDVCSHPVWAAPTGPSPMGVPWQQTGTPMGSWQHGGTPLGSSAKAT